MVLANVVDSESPRGDPGPSNGMVFIFEFLDFFDSAKEGNLENVFDGVGITQYGPKSGAQPESGIKKCF